MVERFRGRLTYANVMSTVAVFLALGGGVAWALANNSVRSKHIVNGQVKKGDVANDDTAGALTGQDVSNAGGGSLGTADIDESSLGTVPSANSASTVDDYSIVKVDARGTPGGGGTFLDPSQGGGLSLQLNCVSGTNDAMITAFTNQNGSVIQEGTFNGTADNATLFNSDDQFDQFEPFTFDADDDDQVTFTYADSNDSVFPGGGTVVNGMLSVFERGDVFGNTNDKCHVVGTLWISP
jgi:hypothetical protein